MVVTCKTKNNDVEILSRFIRAEAIVDNTHANGIVVPFNKKKGKMCREGSQLLDNDGGIFYKHPDTEVIFDDCQIPYYTQVKKIVTKASSLFKLPLLRWDIAITPNGPIIVGVNAGFHLLLSDRMGKELKRSPSIRSLLEQIH